MLERMNEFDFLELIQQKDRAIRQPPAIPKRRMPHVTRHQSREQRTAFGQTPNAVRAIYVPESKYNVTPVAAEDATLTREVGPGDQFNPEEAYRAGKATTEPTKSAKTAKRGRRAYGGGSNKSKTDYEALANKFMNM